MLKKMLMYRKRLQRLQAIGIDGVNGKEALTHRRKTIETMRKGQLVVRKQLTFHYALTSELRKRCKEQRSNKAIQAFHKVFGAGHILKKYKKTTTAKQCIGLSRSAIKNNERRNRKQPAYERKKHATIITAASRECVRSFFCRNDNSKATAGVRETVTRDEKTMQKRYLLKSVSELYKVFAAKNPAKIISASPFTRLKPFWVNRPKIHDRETCLCKQHENIQYKLSKLKDMQQVAGSTFEDTVQTVVCDKNAKDCMYRECERCKKKAVLFTSDEHDQDMIWWWQ